MIADYNRRFEILFKNTLLFTLLYPILVVCPAGFSMAREQQLGVQVYMVSREGQSIYQISRHLSAFLATMIVFAVPFLLEILLNCLSFSLLATGNMSHMSIYDREYIGAVNRYLMKSIYLVSPYLYAVAGALLFAIVSGLFGCFTMAVSSLIRLRYNILLFLPVFIMLNFSTILSSRFLKGAPSIKWYIREVCRLGSAVCLFYVFLLATVITATAFCYELRIDSAGMILAVYHLFIHGLWVYSMTLTVNLLALYLGSSTAYALVAGVQMVFVVMLNIMDLIVRRLADGISYQKKLIWNPVAHLVLGWHSSKMETVNQVLTPMYLQMDLDYTLILFLLFGVSVTYVGAVIIKKHEINIRLGTLIMLY